MSKRKAKIFERHLKTLNAYLKYSGINKVYYFHTDHFEPTGLDHETIVGDEVIEKFISETSLYNHSKRMSLFYRPTFKVMMADDLQEGQKHYKADDDSVVFVEDEKTIKSKEILKTLNEQTEHEFQLHIHHEHFTNSDEIDKDIKHYVINDSTSEMDEKRFEKYVKISRNFMRQGLGKSSYNDWFFIHGKWGLNGSDRRVCRIEDELRILARNGCIGDFTFPAGRRHCNPHIQAPFVTKPIRTLKCYDYCSSESEEIKIKGKAMMDYIPRIYGLYPGKCPFFIWSSQLKHPMSSLDYFSEKVSRQISMQNKFLKILLRDSVKIHDMLFIKTYSHSLSDHFINKEKIIFPLLHPSVIAAFKTLERLCLVNNIELNYVTASEIYKIFKGIDSGRLV
jgi:hypothetical protein